MSKEIDFKNFLFNIEPSYTTEEHIISAHNTLRAFLKSCVDYRDKVEEIFLIGSYAKNTCIRPSKYDGKPDVDIAIVTNYTGEDDSKEVLDELYKVLKIRYGIVKKQARSIGIEMGEIEIDVVPMIRKNGSEILQIGNKLDGGWKDTNPKGHLKWCTETNKNNRNKFIPLVKIFKWWRKNNCPQTLKFPKGITLEKIIADNISSQNIRYEELTYYTMKNIKEVFEKYIELNLMLPVYDPGIPTDNLSNGYEYEDYKSFYNKLSEHIQLLEKNNFSNEVWRQVLGTEFPKGSRLGDSIRYF